MSKHTYDVTVNAQTGEVTEERTLFCADCLKDITKQKTHECKEQRAANRRAQRRANEIRIADLRAANRRHQGKGKA